MEKSTKAALAAGAAAVLLLGGGAGTIAFWTDSATVNGGEITHGTLAIEPGAIDGGTDDAAACDADWVHADAGATPGYTGQPAVGEVVDLVVPGDVIEKSCTFTVTATGDHLQATLDAPAEVTWATSAETFTATVDAAYTLNGVAMADDGKVTSANDGQTLEATFTVTIDYGTAGADLAVDNDGVNDNITQSTTAALDALTVTLTQDDH